jgi:PTH1 family peptidyl-tRNA hydrolase
MKQGGGAAGHNGLKDISARLATHDYWRLRIGIGHPGHPGAVTDYVLHKPSQEDRAAIDAAIARALEVLPLMLAGDHQGAMLKLHTEPEPARAERPVKAEAARPAKAEAAAKKKATTGEAPAKPARPAPAEKAPKVEKEEAASKGGGIGSFLKKLIPGSDAARKK